MADALSLPPLRDVIRRHGLAARKSLGQNFLLDLNLTRRIARSAAPLDGFNVIEIGPGPGGLTRALLLEGARRVVAIERDARCLPALAELASIFPGRLEVVPGDALAIDPTTLTPAPRKIVANLPYNIATPLLVAWLPHLGEFADYTLMFQKEVALRLAAKPGTSEYGRLSVLTQWLAYVERLFDVTPKAFVPPPKVTSTLVRLTPRPKPQAPCDQDALERVTAAVFGQRRKMLRQSLKPLGDAARLLHDAMVDPTARAEALTVSEFCALARALMITSI
ncbi:MAG: 16S rRNA (adenine(1518)-N(6)/adenine(1519)-N(6))-dimethyltransferase RsmA [Alphaproteobacteria bacterium]|nr:16S rRNA (adenine(1518)-N(6)/adenine(1519)-N(6))-dimethyltransferase RsmA [Alphaproteobacteria bacterium]